jgi:hypothetical protein
VNRTASGESGRGESEAEADVKPFVSSRIGDRPQAMVVFRKKNGSVRGFSYVLFYSIEADNPAEGFSMEFSQVRVTITGRNLESLFHMVCMHRVAEIREVDASDLFKTNNDEPAIERIDFRNKKGGEAAANG